MGPQPGPWALAKVLTACPLPLAAPRDLAKAAGRLAAAGEGGQAGEGVPLGNADRLRGCGPGQECRGHSLDPKDQHRSSEGIMLDEKEKVLALTGTQARDFQERPAVNS